MCVSVSLPQVRYTVFIGFAGIAVLLTVAAGYTRARCRTYIIFMLIFYQLAVTTFFAARAEQAHAEDGKGKYC